MPQISKIRIANFQYNDGNRLIADELYDFESENKEPSDVLINLANGGGKSVLVQLVMQPIIPKARVAGRKIESFFKKASDHCYVVLEWSLDNSKMKLMTGIAMSASDASGESDSDRGFQIKYYTFISGYQDYRGNYNIVNLPLSRRENGRYIPAAFDDIRNLAKRSNRGLERYASDDSVKWKERLAQYGIVQNEWRMIEELNSNEDGMSKYFSNLKTSDAVIDRLIIPRIEEKQTHSASKDDSSLETMLISYAKQFCRQKEIIKEREICSGFYSMLELTGVEAEELWKGNDAFEKCVETLFAYSDALGLEIDRNRDLAEAAEKEKNKFGQEIRHIEWEKASADYYTCRERFERESENLRRADAARTEAGDSAEEARQRLLLVECAHYYGQLKAVESQADAIIEEIKARENHSEAGDRLAALKYSAFMAVKAELASIKPALDQVSDDRRQCEMSVDEINRELAAIRKDLEKSKSEADKADAVLERQVDEDDALVDELGIGAFRMFDGRYQEEELKSWQTKMENKEADLQKKISANTEKLQKIELRREDIPQEIADVKNRQKEIGSEIDEMTRRLDEFYAAENHVKAVFGKYGIDDSLRFTSCARDYLDEQLMAVRASVKDTERKIEATEEAIRAVQRGTLHIPGLILEYLDAVGIHYTTFEKYLLTQQTKAYLSQEDCRQILTRYPFAAYGVIVNEADRKILEQEAKDQWLPAVLPVFTDADVEKLLSNEMASFCVVAAYASDYFNDSIAYASDLREVLRKQREHQALYEAREQDMMADRLVIENFAVYDEAWERRNIVSTDQLKKQADEAQENISGLQSELDELKKQIVLCKDEEKRLETEQRNVRNVLSGYEKLMVRLHEEDALYQSLEDAKNRLRELQKKEKDAAVSREKKENELKQLEAGEAKLKASEAELKEASSLVADAAEAELISGAWDSLLSQYKTLMEAQSADLKRLIEDKKRLLRERQEKQKEIQKRHCDPADYENLIYTEAAEDEAIKDMKIKDQLLKASESEYTKADRAQVKAETNFENSRDQLAVYGGEPLPFNEIGKAFETRILEIRTKLDELREQEMQLADTLSRLQKVQGKAEIAAESYTRPARYNRIELETDYTAQLELLTKNIRACRNLVLASERKVEESLKKMSEVYGAVSADVNLAISSMRELLSNISVRGDRYYTLCEHINANMHTVQLRISQIDTDLREFHKTKDDLIHQCMIQGKQMYDGLLQLSNNSRVMVQGRRRQMIKFDIPEAVDENLARANISSEIDKGTEEIAAKMAEDAYAESDIRKTALRTVGSRRLLRRYINAENIVMKAYKIDSNPDHSGYRTWNDTQVNNSGAEKFVVYFAVILALMAFTRDDGDGMGGKNKSVLVLDNPFGPISSRHVLEPVFEISRNYNVQMICLSDISKSDIVSCFELVIRAVVKRFALSSKEQLTHEGNEIIEHGFYRAEQMDLGSFVK